MDTPSFAQQESGSCGVPPEPTICLRAELSPWTRGCPDNSWPGILEIVDSCYLREAGVSSAAEQEWISFTQSEPMPALFWDRLSYGRCSWELSDSPASRQGRATDSLHVIMCCLKCAHVATCCHMLSHVATWCQRCACAPDGRKDTLTLTNTYKSKEQDISNIKNYKLK